MFDPTILQKRIDLVKEQIAQQRASDQELLNWKAKIEESNKLKVQQGRRDLQALPDGIIEAEQREMYRSQDCHNNSPFERLYVKTDELCSFESMEKTCSKDLLQAQSFSDRSIIKIKESMQGENPISVSQGLRDLRREIGRKINSLFEVSDSCARQGHAIAKRCIQLYDETLSEDVLRVYINTCTEESLDQQVVEYNRYMNGPLSPVYSINRVITNHQKLRGVMAELGATLLKLDKYIKTYFPNGTDQRLKDSKIDNEVPTS